MSKIREFMINGWQGVTKPSSVLLGAERMFDQVIENLEVCTKIDVSDGLTAIKTEDGLAYYIAGYKLAFFKYKCNGFKLYEVRNIEELYKKVEIEGNKFIDEAHNEWQESIKKLDEGEFKTKLLELEYIIIDETMKCNFIEGFKNGIDDVKELFEKVS